MTDRTPYYFAPVQDPADRKAAGPGNAFPTAEEAEAWRPSLPPGDWVLAVEGFVLAVEGIPEGEGS